MSEDSRNPSRRVRAAAASIHQAGVNHGWFKGTYKELESTDLIGFQEFNELIVEALAAADATNAGEL